MGTQSCSESGGAGVTPLRVLLIEGDPREADGISSALTRANHAVLPAAGLEEASEAVLVQKFDAVLLASPLPLEAVAEFSAHLRTIEKSQGNATRIPVLSYSRQAAEMPAQSAGGDLAVDAYLPSPFDTAAFAQAVANLARNVAQTPQSFPVFEVENFKAQVAYDDDLLIEIIDLFLIECAAQVSEMRTALAAGNYDQLSRVAHTIKGSLSNLYAGVAKAHAQDLELAAKNGDAQQSGSLLQVLESDLAVLEPLLLALRATSSAR
jgi:DNA-binding response OmpR family regulator